MARKGRRERNRAPIPSSFPFPLSTLPCAAESTEGEERKRDSRRLNVLVRPMFYTSPVAILISAKNKREGRKNVRGGNRVGSGGASRFRPAKGDSSLVLHEGKRGKGRPYVADFQPDIQYFHHPGLGKEKKNGACAFGRNLV